VASVEQLTAELEALNALILEILSRRAVRGEWNGRAYTLHSIKDLYEIRRVLEAELAGLDAGGRQVRTIVPRG
jgi:hypothetical protein